MKPVLMPIVGQDYKTGTIIEWKKKEGEQVKKGDVVLIVESEKATFDVEADESGVVLKVLYAEGEEAEVLTPVAYVGQAGEQVPGAQVPGVQGPAKEATTEDQSAPAPAAAPSSVEGRGGKIFSSPLARKVARTHGVDITRLSGTGPGGRILKQDVLAAASQGGGRALAAPAPAAPAPAGEDTVVPFSRMRGIIAERLSISKQTVPHFYLFADVDMETPMQLRESYNLRNNSRVTVTDIVVAAAARTLKEFPKLNAHVGANQVILKGRVNIGVATSVEDGLLVPVVADAQQKTVLAISEEIKTNAQRVRSGKQANAETGSFTISSLGMFKVSSFLPIINPPECAILGVGTVEPRVVAQGSYMGVRRMMTLSLSCDHRAGDGVLAAQFMEALEKNLSRVLQE